jgi:ceramide glucosyltransferase
LNIIGLVGLVALGAYLGLLVLRAALASSYAKTHRETATRSELITVVQPILSGDPALESALRANLEIFARDQSIRVLWLIDENDAEGRRLGNELATEQVSVLLCAQPGAHENPKTAKLEHALTSVSTPLIAVLDDDTVLSPDHLGRAIAALSTSTLYTGLPCYLPGTNLWSSLVAHFVNNNSILTYLPLLPMTPPLTINGMFYVMRMDELRAMGGFTSIKGKLCDDYALAAQVKAHGGSIRQGTTPLFLRTTVPDARRYFGLMQRWFLFANVLLRDQPARLQLLVVPLLGLPPLLFALSFLSLTAGLIPSLLFVFALAFRHLALRSLHRLVLGETELRFHPLVSILSELLQPVHWLHASLQHTLQWRTRRIVLGPDGTFSYVGQR